MYNGSKYLEKSISSALEQKFKGSFEILLVDDCSNDDSYEIAQKFELGNKEVVRVIRNTANKGLTSNWNSCVEEARGEWIKFLFQDDYMSPGCIQIMYDRAVLDKSLFVICNRNFLIEENSSQGLKSFFTNHVIKLNRFFASDTYVSPEHNQSIAEKNILMNYLGEPICFLYHKSVARRFGEFNNYISQLCDYEFALRVVSNIGFSYVNQELVTFRVSSDSTTFKNHSEKRVVLKYVEPLLLLHLFIWSKAYKNYRVIVKRKTLFAEYRKYLNELNKLGIRRAHKILEMYFREFPFLHLHKLYFIVNKIKKTLQWG